MDASGDIEHEKDTMNVFELYFISTYITPMSNPNCYYQSCTMHCCNYQGFCPENYVSGSQSYCYYYYPSSSDTGSISGAVVGAVIGVVIILAIACYCYKKRQAAQLMQQQLATGNGMNTMQNMAYTQPNQPIYGQQAYGQAQPQYGQPQYGQPQYGQPQYGQPQYGQPQYGQPQYGQQQPIIVVT